MLETVGLNWDATFELDGGKEWRRRLLGALS